jgi:rSAM/selenodomain-associated transferase 1
MRQFNSRAPCPLVRHSKKALILFTSHPGKDEFRKYLGHNPGQCQVIYQAFLRHVLGIAITAQEQLNFDIIIASEAAELPHIENTFGGFPDAAPFIFLEQQGDAFDDKFKHALKTTFQKGYGQVVIIGNDCLDITPETLQKAFDNLSRHEVVLGPATDGGFYLLGISEYNPSLFREIHWGTASVFRQVYQNISSLQQLLCLLPCLGDIDSYQDLSAWLYSPHTSWANRVYRLLVCLITIQIIPAFYPAPFLSKFHQDKKIWQLPPPLPA